MPWRKIDAMEGNWEGWGYSIILKKVVRKDLSKKMTSESRPE